MRTRPTAGAEPGRRTGPDPCADEQRRAPVLLDREPGRADQHELLHPGRERERQLGRDIVDQIHKVFGDKLFETVITKSVRLEESPAYKESIFSFAPRSTGAYEYYRLSEEVLSRV